MSSLRLLTVPSISSRVKREGPERWWPDLATVWLLAQHRAAARVQALPMYVALTAAFLAGSFAMRAFASDVLATGFVITPDPLLLPLHVIVLIAVLYAGFVAVIAVTRDREQGILELLFYAPLSYADYVLGRALEGVLAFLPAALLSLLYTVAIGLMSGIGVGKDVIIAIAAAVIPGAVSVALALLVGAAVGHVRLGTALYGVVIGLMLAVQGGDYALNQTISSGPTGGSLLMLRSPIDAVAVVVSWLSPAGYLAHGFDAVQQGVASGLLLTATTGMLYMAALVAAASFLLHVRGVRP